MAFEREPSKETMELILKAYSNYFFAIKGGDPGELQKGSVIHSRSAKIFKTSCRRQQLSIKIYYVHTTIKAFFVHKAAALLW